MGSEDDLKRSEELLSEASKAEWRGRNLVKSVDFNGAVEAAQHCIELSIKAMYQLIGLPPPKPKSHDVGIELEKVVRRLVFPNVHKYLRERLARIRWISTMWAWAHSTSMYGYLDIPASRIFKEKDAKIAVEYASEVLSDCRTILNLVKLGQIKVREACKQNLARG
jgi:HEPN domain-containing protein